MGQQQINPTVLNAQQRAIVLGSALKVKQQIYSGSFNPANQNIVNVQVKPVGLVLGFLVVVEGAVTNGAGAVANRTPFGTSNMLKRMVFTDSDNINRIDTTGSHLAIVNSARQGFGFGGVYQPNLPMGYGSNWGPFQGPSTVAASSDANLKHMYYMPCAYSSQDLRGAVYAGFLNAPMNLQFEINKTPFAATDTYGPVYSGNAAGVWKNTVTITVYQVYLDQIPTMQGGAPVLPMQDITTLYHLQNRTYTAPVIDQDYGISYASMRKFLSTTLIYANGDALNAGSDITRISLDASNSMKFFDVTPDVAALDARQTFMADPPSGTYYFDHRERPIDTITFGNMELTVKPKVVNANARFIVGFESFQDQGAVGMAPALSVS